MVFSVRAAVLWVALLSAALILAVVSTQAKSSAATLTSGTDGGQRNCVATVGESVVSQQEMKCFSTFRAAISEATGGRVRNAPADASGFAADRGVQKRVFADGAESSTTDTGTRTASSVSGDDVVGCCNVLSVEFEHARFRGNTLTYRIKGHPCDGDKGLEVGANGVPNEWNDEISSYIGSGKCQVKHYEHAFYKGSSTKLRSQDNYMGIFNDATTSIKWG